MNDLARFLCIVVSVTGSVQCLSLLRDCRKRPGSSREPASQLWKSARHNSICTRVNRLCQILLATAFLAVAASLIGGFASRAMSLLWSEESIDEQFRRTFATLSIPGYPPLVVNYDTTQLDRPIIAIEARNKPISDEQVHDLLRMVPKLDYLNLSDTNVSDNALSDLDVACQNSADSPWIEHELVTWDSGAWRD